MSDIKSFTNRCKKVRKSGSASGLTQEKLAELVDVNRMSVLC